MENKLDMLENQVKQMVHQNIYLTTLVQKKEYLLFFLKRLLIKIIVIREQIELLLSINRKSQDEIKEAKKAEHHQLFNLVQAHSPEYKPSNMLSKAEEKNASLGAFPVLNLEASENGHGLSQIQRNNFVLMNLLQDALNLKSQGSLMLNPESLLLNLSGQK